MICVVLLRVKKAKVLCERKRLLISNWFKAMEKVRQRIIGLNETLQKFRETVRLEELEDV